MDWSTAGLPCASPTPRVYSDSCPLSRWYHPAISSSVIPFSSCLQSFPASESFPVSQFFTSGGQSIGASASTSIRPSDDYSGVIFFRMDWFDLLAVQGTQESSPTPQLKSIASVLSLRPFPNSSSRWWLVQRSLPGPPVLRQLMHVVAKMWARPEGSHQCFP